MARPEVACVLHTHSIAGCAVSMQKDGLLPLNQHALQVIGDIAYHDYEGSARSPEERARFLSDLGDRHIMVLRNHGLLIVGTSIAAAFVATYRMERACVMQLAFQQSGADFHPIADEVVGAAYDNAGIPPTGGRNDPAKFEWPALLCKLDRIDQGSGEELRRFGAKPRKNFVDDQAASPSSWKTPRMAVWMAAEWRSIGFGFGGPGLGGT